MCSYARRGSNRMSWIFWQMSAYHVALAWYTAWEMWRVRCLRSNCIVAWIAGGRWLACLTACLRVLRSVYSGARVERIIWNQPSHWRL
jgi:hypothetical protein